MPVATSPKIKDFPLSATPARSRAWRSSSSAYISADPAQASYSCYEFMVAVSCSEDRSHSPSPHLLPLTFFLPPLQRCPLSLGWKLSIDASIMVAYSLSLTQQFDLLCISPLLPTPTTAEIDRSDNNNDRSTLPLKTSPDIGFTEFQYQAWNSSRPQMQSGSGSLPHNACATVAPLCNLACQVHIAARRIQG